MNPPTRPDSREPRKLSPVTPGFPHICSSGRELTHQQPSGQTAAGLRTALLATALTLSVLSVPAHAAQADENQPNGGFSAGTYVVQLADAPVASYKGGLHGLRRTAPQPGSRLDSTSSAVRSYLRHLKERRDTVLESVHGVKALYNYVYTLNGFAARLTAKQAAKLAGSPGVMSVTRSTTSHPAAAPETTHTSPVKRSGTADTPRFTQTATVSVSPRSAPGRTTTAPVPDIPRFLGLSGKNGLWSKSGGGAHAGEGMIIGVIDTGFDPGNPLLAPLPEPRPDADVIARKWKGSCDEGDDSAPQHKVTCNNKVIGAAWFRADMPDPQPTDVPSPRDMDMHGTHTSTTAAGDYDTPATIPGANVSGTISGVAPAARLAVYKACWSNGCGDVNTAAAIDRAVADGVDVISYSIGGGLPSATSMEAMFNATKAGVFVSAAAGNSGPNTVENTAPWITTVAAETHDTRYTASLVLGDGRRFTTPALTIGVPTTPLVNAVDARSREADPAAAALCAPDTLDPGLARGKIIVCDRGSTGFTYQDRYDALRASGAVGVIMVNTPTSAQDTWQEPQFPTIMLGKDSRDAIKKYAASPGATATFTPTASAHVQAPVITGFSSSGPDPFSGGDLLKPDITTPGDMVASGTVPGGANHDLGQFGFMGGTSAATPQIAGLAALLKSLHPNWSPMEVKSALMTTATTTDNTGEPLSRGSGDSPDTVPATPLDFGAGTPRARLAADPGLVYDSTAENWTAYLCSIGFSGQDEADTCSGAPKTDPSDLNYPTISVGDLYGRQTVTRTVKNVSSTSATYQAKLHTPVGYKAEVTPRRLSLAPGASATYKVTFTRTRAQLGQWEFGTLTWSDAHSQHRVTSQIALRAALFGTPKEVDVVGHDSVTVTSHVSWNGELTARAELNADSRITGTLYGTEQSDFPGLPPASDAVAKTHIHVPENAPFTRVAISATDHLPGSDLDLYAFDKSGQLVGPWPGSGSDEHADLPPGDYDIYVVQFALPEGVTQQPYTLRVWKVGQGGPGPRTTTKPAVQRVAAGSAADVSVSWTGAQRGEIYLGVVTYGDGSKTVGRTVLSVGP
ncbi:S8 family serine peptidase [Streptomyces sp. NPDC005811]|uniref:S8 family serine peptidase n=1 Tax=Streptomyces sp. NPDC005811 TaxID=3154565 RepID=UPI003406C10B